MRKENYCIQLQLDNCISCQPLICEKGKFIKTERNFCEIFFDCETVFKIDFQNVTSNKKEKIKADETIIYCVFNILYILCTYEIKFNIF